MQSLVHPFTDIETAYRSERITESFRARAAGRHRHLLRRRRHDVTGPVDVTEIADPTSHSGALRAA